MKILRIIARLNIGGPARNAVLLAEGLSQRTEIASSSLDKLGTSRNDNTWDGQGSALNNWETVLVCGEIGEGEGDMMWLAREKGIEPVIIPELGRKLSFINDCKAFWKIYRVIRREKPDIIHTHTAKAGTLGRMAAVLYNAMQMCSRPNLFTNRLHGQGSVSNKTVIVHTFHGHVLYGYFGKIKSWVFLWIEKILSLFTDKIITVSGSLKEELVEKFRMASENKVSVVELGFELGGLLKLPIRENSDCVNIGIVGRLVPIKNHKMFLRVVKRITEIASAPAAHRNDNGVKFIIIGDGELRQELENYARELGVEDIVEFRGWIKDAAEIYRDLDIVVLTSLNEGTPVSIIESMSAGRTVVATNVGGVKDIIEDGKSGYLVDP
ncbi:glycosyltransferase, partial [Candidatus Omnitrophota bacterium]